MTDDKRPDPMPYTIIDVMPDRIAIHNDHDQDADVRIIIRPGLTREDARREEA